MDKSSFVFTCVVLKEDSGFSALCLDTDVASEGDTIDEAKQKLGEAVNLYIESAIENNLPIIRPVPQAENPQHTRPEDVAEMFRLTVNVQVAVHV
ncbi:type II toxin-antitoxin system HicB family antitoxin [Sphingobacteriales bacterium CHB3]|nr:type II toxin-antitoxin system HicB family antitoxin [Sphingobacteriales bacterium CHB3]